MSVRTMLQRVSRPCVLVPGLAVLLMCSSPASAQPQNKKTAVRFNEPVEIPGVGAQVLPAGNYVFRVLDSKSDRHVVQVFSADEKHVYATILAIANFRLRATDKTVMTFAERAAGEPPAIRAWFYPGDNWGQEFVYPKKRALELARITNQPILYIPDELAPNIVAPVTSANEAPVIALEEVPVRAVRPTGEDIAIADVVEAPPQQVARLPKTASTIPGFFLMGLLFMGVGFALKTSCARA